MIQTPQVEIAQDNEIIRSFLERRELTYDDIAYLAQPDSSHQHNPFLLRGMETWIDTLHHVKGEKVAIIPDYDADGVLSGTLARVGLYLLGFGDAFVLPPRASDGYGISKLSIDRVREQCPEATVLVTTDNGSNAHDGVQYAKSLGFTVLVTDHHLATDAPLADAVVNPNGHGDTTYPFPAISGTAVIYKALLAYFYKFNQEEAVFRNMQTLVLLVGASTISDVMPLLDENRYFVTEAVRMLTHFEEGSSDERLYAYTDNPLDQYFRGVDLLLLSLRGHGKLKYGIDSDTFGFVIGPMLNSPRRMTGDSTLGFSLFQTRKEDLKVGIRSLPGEALYALNEERKVYVKQLTNELLHYIETSDVSPIEHMVFSVRMESGIAGLLSNNFTKTYGLPSVAFGTNQKDEGGSIINPPLVEGRLLSGSARAPQGFNLHQLLETIDRLAPGLMVKWGGHEEAAGITIRAENLDMFRQAFLHVCMELVEVEEDDGLTLGGDFLIVTNTFDKLPTLGVKPSEDIHLIDARVEGSINTHKNLWGAIRFFEEVAPFGQGFSAPSFTVSFYANDIARAFYMGAEKQHVKCTLMNGLHVIYWNGAETFKEGFKANNTFVAKGPLSINEYNGNVSLQLIADSFERL